MQYLGPISVWYSLTVYTTITVNYYEMQIHAGIISFDVNCWKDKCPNKNDYQEYWDLPRYHYIDFNDPLYIIANPKISVKIDSGVRTNKCKISNFREYYNRII